MRSLLFLLVIFSLSANADLLLVSDVDDTIKNSSVLDLDSAYANVTGEGTEKNEFFGMAVLYRLLKDNNQQMIFKYLSNGIDSLVGERHQKFLLVNGYPAGSLDMNPAPALSRIKRHFLNLDESGPGHKIKKLREYLSTIKPQQVILVGDNGEKDIEIYDQITKEFPQVKFHTFIHVVYNSGCKNEMCGKELKEGQIPFVTAVDLAVQLHNLGYLEKSDVEWLLNKFFLALSEQGFALKRGQPLIFPAWISCAGFVFPSDLAEKAVVGMGPVANAFMTKVKNFTDVRCSIPLISK